MQTNSRGHILRRGERPYCFSFRPYCWKIVKNWEINHESYHFMVSAVLSVLPRYWQPQLSLKVLNLWQFTQKWSAWISDSYCILKPLWPGIGEVVPAHTSPTLHPPSHCAVIMLIKSVPVHQFVVTSTLRVETCAVLYGYTCMGWIMYMLFAHLPHEWYIMHSLSLPTCFHCDFFFEWIMLLTIAGVVSVKRLCVNSVTLRWTSNFFNKAYCDFLSDANDILIWWCD